MRLTLRAMLAYIEDLLEPADAEELSKKIEESEFATGLLARIRDVTRRLRLGAPRLDGRGLALDANSVAEYLDNTMAPDRVAEFEKICLQSDVHLAEVASAHQILALVLGEPAEVEPKLRRRMYALIDAKEASTVAPQTDEEYRMAPAQYADPTIPQIEAHSGRRRPAIPEWLREQPKRRSYGLPAAIGIAALLVIGATAFVLYSRSDSEPVAARDTLPPAPPAPTTAAQSSMTPEGTPTYGATSVPAANPPPPSEPIAENATPTDLPPENATREPRANPTELDSTALTPAIPEAAVEPVPIVAPDATSALDDPALIPQAAPTDLAPVLDVPMVTPIGRLVTENEVLLRRDGPEQWRRLSIREALLAGDELVALPTFRPNVVLSAGGGVTLQMVGGSVVGLVPPHQGAAGIHLIDGQVVMLTPGASGTRVNVQIGDQVYQMTFVAPDATLALEVRRTLVDGADPAADASMLFAELYVHSGEIQYLDPATGATESIKAPARRVLIAPTRQPPAADTTLPGWITGEPLSQVEKWAAEAVEKALVADEPARLRLRELAENRRVEFRNLAVMCLTLLGDFEGFLPLLNDSTQRANWNNQIEMVRRTLARDPNMAARLKTALASQCDSTKAAVVYRMLVGFSRQELLAGEDARLVADLDSEELDLRVLAFWNLQRFSVGTLGYRPEYPAAKRQSSVRAWKQRLDSGQIVPKTMN